MPCMRYVRCNGEWPAGGGDFHPGLRGMNQRRRVRAIARLDPHQHIGDGGLQSHELDTLAAEAARRADDLTLDNRVGQLAQPGFDEVARTFGKLQNDGQPHAGQHRRTPDDVVAVGSVSVSSR